MATEDVIPRQSDQGGTKLRAGAIGLAGATMQSIAHIAPAIAGLFFTQFVVSLTGVTAPLAYLLGILIVLMLGSTLVQLSKHMSAAGGLLNPSRSYFLVDGLILVLAVLYIYVSANVAVALYYLRQRRDEFNWILHIALPVISTAALVYVTIKSFQPFPSFPYNYAPLIDAIWFVIGLGILSVLWYRKKDDWIAKAGAATVDADEIKEIDPA